MRVQSIIILSLFISISSHASSPNQVASCRQGSTTYDTYASYLDNILSILIKGYRPGTNEYKEKMRIYIRNHEDYKDKEYQKLLEVQKILISDKKLSFESSEVWRMTMEASIDFAYVVAGDNMINDQLGRSNDHYRRKIYDMCISSK